MFPTKIESHIRFLVEIGKMDQASMVLFVIPSRSSLPSESIISQERHTVCYAVQFLAKPHASTLACTN